MGAVDFHRIESQRLRRGLRKGPDRVHDRLPAHGDATELARRNVARRTFKGSRRQPPGFLGATIPGRQSCGAMAKPAACAWSITAFQQRSGCSPQKRGTAGSLDDAGQLTTVPSEMINPASPAARRA